MLADVDILALPLLTEDVYRPKVSSTNMGKLIRILLTAALILGAGFGIFWDSRPADVSFDAVRTEVPYAEYSHFADIDGVRIHYQEKGSGPVLLLLHGWGSSTYTWKDV